MAGMKTIVGGEIAGYTEMIMNARQIATKRMVDDAESLGADAQLTKPEIGKLIAVVDELVAKYEDARKGK